MGTEGYDYPREPKGRECARCGGTGYIYTIGRMTESGDLEEVREVDEREYKRHPQDYETETGEWCRDEVCECPCCDGTGWIDGRQLREWAEEERAEAEREERLLRAAGF